MLTGDLLKQAAQRHPARRAVICDDTVLTYRELDAHANRVANALLAHGIGGGRKAAIMARNRPYYPAIYFGAARSGGVLANVSVRSATEELRYALDKAEVELMFAEAAHLPQIAEVRPQLPRLRRVVALDAEDAAPPAGADETLAAFLGAHGAAPPEAEIADTDPFAITFTGGTTGFPKAVVVSHKARCATSMISAAEFGLDERDVVACVTPLFHTAGLFSWYQTAVTLGCSCVLLPGWDSAAFIDAVARHAISAAFLVPSQLNALINDPAFDAARLASLRKMNFAGAPMAPALFERLRRALPAVEFAEHYGQSEACPLTVRRHWAHDGKTASVGRAVVGIELAVLDDAGRVLPPGETGHVVTRGDHLLSEYYRDPEQTAALFEGHPGWLATGDIGAFDADGYLSLYDRSKDMIISGGENVYPAEIENALYTHADVRECAVFGIPDERWGEVPAAYVVLRNGAGVSADDLIAFCAARIARHKRPRLVKFVDGLPKTAVGKVRKNVLRAPFWEGRERAI